MNKSIFTPVSSIPKSIEVVSLVDQMDKQYITAGLYLSNQIEDKYNTEHDGKQFKIRDYMEGQRSYTWEKWRASNFIVSVMLQSRIPEIWLYRKDDRDQHKKCLDGQQRLTTLWLFVYDKFSLDMSRAEFNKFPFGNKIYSVKNDLHGKKFSELPQEWRDSILHYSMDAQIFNNCSDEQAEHIYTEMANGTKPLRAIEVRKTGMGTGVRNFIYSIINQRWILHMMTTSSAFGSRGLDILSQFITLAKNNGPIDLSRNSIDEAIYDLRDMGISDELQRSINNAGAFIGSTLDAWIQTKKDADKKRVIGRKVKNYGTYRFPMFRNKTITLMFLWAGYRALQKNVSLDAFQKWSYKFFTNPNAKFKRGLPDKKSKTGDFVNVKIRIEAIDEELDKLSHSDKQSDKQEQGGDNVKVQQQATIDESKQPVKQSEKV